MTGPGKGHQAARDRFAGQLAGEQNGKCPQHRDGLPRRRVSPSLGRRAIEQTQE